MDGVVQKNYRTINEQFREIKKKKFINVNELFSFYGSDRRLFLKGF